MSRRIRLKNGQLIRESTVNKRKKAIAAMQEAKQKRLRNKNDSDDGNNVCQGNRIVNFQELAKNLKCCNCKDILSLNHIADETREGLYSLLKIECTKCKTINLVRTGRKIESNNHTFAEVNLLAVLGK